MAKKFGAKDTGERTAYWIDHVTVPTNNINAWNEWADMVLGLLPCPMAGLSSMERKHGIPVHCFHDIAETRKDADLPGLTPHHIGVFTVPEPMPEDVPGLGKATPRSALYVRTEDLDQHLARLEKADQWARNPGPGWSTLAGRRSDRGIPYSDSIRTAIGGEEGTVVYFEDPDGNQWEFWAPDEMPEGAMSSKTRLGVGRIARITFGCREVENNAEFFARYGGLEATAIGSNSEILVLPLAFGARLVYEKRDVKETRTKDGTGVGVHVALAVEKDDLLQMLEEMWADLPEWNADGSGDVVAEEGKFLPPHTEMHGSPVGRRWKQMLGRGDYFSDCDGHMFHFYGIYSNRKDGSLIDYDARETEEYLEDLAKEKGLEVPEHAPI